MALREAAQPSFGTYITAVKTNARTLAAALNSGALPALGVLYLFRTPASFTGEEVLSCRA